MLFSNFVQLFLVIRPFGMSCVAFIRYWKLAVIFGALWVQTFGSDSTECTYSLYFPTLHNDLVLAPENSAVTLPFGIKATCQLPDEFSIDIFNEDASPSNISVPVIVCTIWYANGTCRAARATNCSCTQKRGEYVFRTTVKIDDNATWTWRINVEQTQTEFQLIFIVTPATHGTQNTSNSAATAVGVVFVVAVLAGVAIFIIYRKTKGGKGIRVQCLKKSITLRAPWKRNADHQVAEKREEGVSIDNKLGDQEEKLVMIDNILYSGANNSASGRPGNDYERTALAACAVEGESPSAAQILIGTLGPADPGVGNQDDRDGQHETLVMIDNVLYEGGNDNENQRSESDYEETEVSESAVREVPNTAAQTVRVVRSKLPASDAGDYTTLKVSGNSLLEQQDDCTKAAYDHLSAPFNKAS